MCIRIFFVLKHTLKRKGKQTEEEKRKTKETKEEKETENVVVVDSICGKSNVIQYWLWIFSVYF